MPPVTFFLFAAWAVACAAAALKQRLAIWLVLWIPPFAFVCWEWLHPPADTSFGPYPWGDEVMFFSICLVVASTGILAIKSARRTS